MVFIYTNYLTTISYKLILHILIPSDRQVNGKCIPVGKHRKICRKSHQNNIVSSQIFTQSPREKLTPRKRKCTIWCWGRRSWRARIQSHRAPDGEHGLLSGSAAAAQPNLRTTSICEARSSRTLCTSANVKLAVDGAESAPRLAGAGDAGEIWANSNATPARASESDWDGEDTMGRHGLDLEAGQAVRSDVGSDGGGEGRGDRNRRRWRRSDLESGEDKVWGRSRFLSFFFLLG